MKPSILFLVSLAAFGSTAAGFGQTVLASNNFETGIGTNGPSWFWTTVGSGAAAVSVVSSFVSEPGNRYGHYVVTTATMSGNPSARWYAGTELFVPGLSVSNPPPPWTLSFDIRQDTLEPVFVEFLLGVVTVATYTPYRAW